MYNVGRGIAEGPKLELLESCDCRIYKWMYLWRLHPFVHCNMECMEIMYWLLCLLQMYILGD